MKTHVAALSIAVVLGTTTLSTFAQRATTPRPTAHHRKTVAAKPVARQSTLIARSSTAATPSGSRAEKTSGTPAQPVASQTTTVPVVTRTEQAAPLQATPPAAKYLNVGVGAAAYYGGGFPVGASLEVDVAQNLSVGGSVDYMRYAGGYNLFYLGARGSYHLATLLDVQDARFDPYAGATLGYQHIGYNYAYEGRSGGLFLGIHVGARYYFSDKIGGFAEVGYGISALKLGLAMKF